MEISSLDINVILTLIGSSAAIIGINIALISWLRADIKDLKTEISADRRDILSLINAIKEETRDFHGRLCRIEEKKSNP